MLYCSYITYIKGGQWLCKKRTGDHMKRKVPFNNAVIKKQLDIALKIRFRQFMLQGS